MKRIAIIGAASGIGAACVAQLKAQGAEVTALDVVPVPEADHYIAVDLTAPDAAIAAASTLEGPYDALICNAGLPPRGDNAGPVLAVNVLGLLAVTQALESQLAAGSAIVVTASRAGKDWQANIDQVRRLLDVPGVADLPGFIEAEAMDATRAYNLSKEAVIYWSKAQAERLLAKGIRINTVSPAPVATGLLDDFVKAFGARAEKTLARVGRAGKPEEIAAVICFLSDPASQWINAQDLIIDGGIGGMMEIDRLTASE